MTNQDYFKAIENLIEAMKRSTDWNEEISENYRELLEYHPESWDDDDDRPDDDKITIEDWDRFELMGDEVEAWSMDGSAVDRENCIDRAENQLKRFREKYAQK